MIPSGILQIYQILQIYKRFDKFYTFSNDEQNQLSPSDKDESFDTVISSSLGEVMVNRYGLINMTKVTRQGQIQF